MLRRKRPVSLMIESLEDRKLLSGNVLVNLGGTTSVKGDDLDNGLEISRGATPDQVIFRGLNGTTVNGSVDSFVAQVTGGLKNLKVDLGNGDDLLVITNLSEATLSWPVASSAQSGEALVVGGNLTIAESKGADAGKDVVLLRHLDIGGSLKVNTGDDDDHVVAESVTVGKGLTQSVGDGNDQILDRLLIVHGKTSIKTGDGNDDLGVYSSVLDVDANVNLGNDNDSAWIESNTLTDVKLVGGKGTNELTEHAADHNTVAANGAFDVSSLDQTLELTASVHFGYENEIGPDHWGDLTPSFLLSEVGRQQSPVNIVTANLVDVALPTIATSYIANSNLAFNHNGHTIQVTIPAGNTITVAGDTYDLLQFHFHTESEHLVNGVAYPLEFHMVHRDAQGNLLVLGVFIEAGAANAAFDDLIANLPDHNGNPSTTIAGPFNPESLLPVDREYYAYNGSLTTPPASEGVSFAIFKTPIQLSADQIDAIVHAIGEHNARPVQPVNDRTIFA